jgi:DNA-binding GntR family transcriptional regulator
LSPRGPQERGCLSISRCVPERVAPALGRHLGKGGRWLSLLLGPPCPLPLSPSALCPSDERQSEGFAANRVCVVAGNEWREPCSVCKCHRLRQGFPPMLCRCRSRARPEVRSGWCRAGLLENRGEESMRPDEIAALLRRAVRERVLLPGQTLNQDELAKRFGVSRIPLREALRTLVGEGLIVMRPGIGAVVTELRVDELNELYDLRLQLEPSLAASLVGHAAGKDIDELEGILARMAALPADEKDEWANLHYLFHRRMYELSGRRHSLRLVLQVLNLVEPYSRVHTELVGASAHLEDEHRAILDALKRSDAEALSELVREGIEKARAQLLEAMGGESSGVVDPLSVLLQARS